MPDSSLSPARKSLFAAITILAVIGAAITAWYTLAPHRPRWRSELYAPMFLRGTNGAPYTCLPKWKGIDHSAPIETNEEGMRDEPWPASPPDGLRVVALGDSQTFGVSVPREEIFSEVLEARLAAATGKPARVYNCGIPGWNFADESAFLRAHWDRLQPAAVVILFIENDLDDSLTAGETHQLAAERRPFETFTTVSDAWIMECFARTVEEKPGLELTLGNAFAESWRVRYYPSPWFCRPETPTGRRYYERYEKDLREFAEFVRGRGSDLCVLVQTWTPGGPLDGHLSAIYDRAAIRSAFIDRWTGDYENAISRWSNLPIDVHGGPKYHRLVAQLAHREIATLLPALKIPAPTDPFPPDAPAPGPARGPWDAEIPPAPVTWEHPESLARTVCMGDPGGSQLRILVKPALDSAYVRVVPREKAQESRDSWVLWADSPAARGFVPTAVAGDSVWGRLPTAFKAGELQELGLVLGTSHDGVFHPVWPVVSIDLAPLPPPGTLTWRDEPPLIAQAGTNGLADDLWMGRLLAIPLLASGPREVEGVSLRLTIEALAPAGNYPLTLTARGAKGAKLAALKIEAPGPAQWVVPIEGAIAPDAPGRVEIASDRVFVPHAVDPASPDTRELSVRVTAIAVIRTAPTETPAPADPKPPSLRIDGLTDDLWMGREASIVLADRKGDGDLVVEFESHAPPAAGPIVITIEDAKGRPLVTRKVSDTGRFTLTVPADRLPSPKKAGRVVVRSDKVWVPSKVVPGNPDGRELSVRVLGAFLR